MKAQEHTANFGLPDDHPLRDVEYSDNLRVTISTWGELKIKRDGFRGAEYHTMKAGLERIGDFKSFGRFVNVFLTFCQQDDKHGFYLPADDEIERVRSLFLRIPVDEVIIEDVPNVRIDGGMSHVPRYYLHRDEADVGLQVCSEWDRKILVPEELRYGFDSSVSQSLYQ